MDVQILMHILKPKCYIFMGFGFLKSRCQMCDDVEILVHISKSKCFLFVGVDFMEV